MIKTLHPQSKCIQDTAADITMLNAGGRGGLYGCPIIIRPRYIACDALSCTFHKNCALYTYIYSISRKKSHAIEMAKNKNRFVNISTFPQKNHLKCTAVKVGEIKLTSRIFQAPEKWIFQKSVLILVRLQTALMYYWQLMTFSTVLSIANKIQRSGTCITTTGSQSLTCLIDIVHRMYRNMKEQSV